MLQVLGAYLEYMTKTGVLLGGEENDTRDQMLDVIEFETRLANVSTYMIIMISDVRWYII